MLDNNAIKHLDVQSENAISHYLLGYANEHPEWKPNLMKAGKNIIDCYNYIVSEARKSHPDEKACMMTDEAVFALAIKYFEDDTIKMDEPEKKPAPTKAKPREKAKKVDDTPSIFDMTASVASDEESASAEGASVVMFPDDDLFDL